MVLTLLLAFLIPPAFSNWVYLGKVADKATINTNEIEVRVHNRLETDEVTKVESTEDLGLQEDAGTFTITKNFDFSYDYKVGDRYGAYEQVKTYDPEISGTNTIYVTEYRQKQITDRSKSGPSGLKVTYTFTYTMKWFHWKVILTETKALPVDSDTTYTYKVENGGYIKPTDIDIIDYTQYDFYSNSSYSTLFDFSKPITANPTHIYIKYIKGTSNLASTISNYTSGTYRLYDSNRASSSSTSGAINVSSDSCYDSSCKFLPLGECTVNSGVTIQMVYGENNVNDGATGGIKDEDAAPYRANSTMKLSDANCSIKIRLNGDLTINGRFDICANVGGINAGSRMSFIIGKYAQIDLNGHNIIVDGGTLNAYGSIVDTIGTGQVIVKNGGKLVTMLTILDGKGGNQMTYGYGKGQSPFCEYRLLYVEARLVIYNGSTLRCYVILDLGGLGLSRTFVNLFGSLPSVFSWGPQSSSNDRIVITPYIVSSLYSLVGADANINNSMLYYRYRIDMFSNIVLNYEISLSAEINKIITEKVTIDLARIGMPLSPFYDIDLKRSYELKLQSQLLLMWGSSLHTEKGSTLVFDSGKTVTYKDVSISVDAFIYKVDVYIKGETKHVCGGLMAYEFSHNFYNTYAVNKNNAGSSGISNLWKNTNCSNHIIEGDIVLSEMTDGTKYQISGSISFSQNNINKIMNNSCIQTYGIKGDQYNSVWFSKDYPTYVSSVNRIQYFNCFPLISNSKAYIKDGSLSLIGTFDYITGLFTNNENQWTYALMTPNHFLEGNSSDPSNQLSLTDYTVTPTRVNKLTNSMIIDANNNIYLYFCGVQVPVISDTSENAIDTSQSYTTVLANLRKFCSNNSTGLYSNATKFDSVQVEFVSTNRWKASASL